MQLETKGRLEAIVYDDIKDVVYTPAEQESILYNRHRMVMRIPEVVKQQLQQYADEYGVDEIMAVNIATYAEERLESYRLLAKVFEL